MSVRRFVIVDSRIRNDPAVGSNYALRLHEDVSDVFIANNQFELASGGIWLNTDGYTGGTSDINNVMIRGNQAYRDTVQEAWHSEVQISTRSGSQIMNVVIEDNNLSLPAGSENMFWQITGDEALGSTIQNNTGSTYTSTPVFAGGRTTRGSRLHRR
jgi:hypothetical protein